MTPPVLQSSYDAVIVGAGFSGIYMLNSLRSLGLKVVLFETANEIGGTWAWNRYPGARVDSDYHIYQFTSPELYKDFDYKERFPCQKEVLSYFQYVDTKLDLNRDIQLNSTVNSAHFQHDSSQWLINITNLKSSEKMQVLSKYFLLCTGFASKINIPPFPGMGSFGRRIYHTSRWEHDAENLNYFKDKRIAVIGTGASGVQVIQELGGQLSPQGQLTVYQRTPNLALPMQQCLMNSSAPEHVPRKEGFPEAHARARTTFAGSYFGSSEKNALNDSPEERKTFYENLFNTGGFAFWIGTYADVLTSNDANDTAYEFWAEKTRSRIKDERKKDILAPLKAPHAFGTKRPSLEQNYYEVFNKENVDIIDLKTSPIVEITPNGIRTQLEGNKEFDVIVLATGFDSVTGGILNIQIENGKGLSIQEKWKQGTSTHLGMSCAGFPNMFFLYGPQAPTAFSNGPSCIEIQGEWLTTLIDSMEKKKQKKVEAIRVAEWEWTKLVKDIYNLTLLPSTPGWYDGSNIPGKIVEPLNYAGGIPSYIQELKQCAQNDYKGLEFE